MSEWTEAAKQVLDEYCSRSRAAVAKSGADADEVIDDLKRHVEEEVRAARMGIVTEEDVRRILARVGEPGVPVEEHAGQPPPVGAESQETKRPGIVLLFFGCLLPLGTLVFEMVSGVSAGVLFDPIPSWFYVLAVALVPAVNFWTWWAGRTRNSRHAWLTGWLNAVAIGICVYYSLMYLLFVPIAAIGIVVYGLGLIPLSPFFALVATSWLRLSYIRRIGAEKLPGFLGAPAGLVLLLLLQLPAALTYHGMAEACSEEPAVRARGVRLLRTFGDDDLLLRACYGLLRRELDLDLVRTVASGNQIVSADQAREIYYRVTGSPFNSVPAPSLFTRGGRWTGLDNEFAWDEGLGGEAIAGRVKGLSLASSRMDAVAEPEAALVYCEWTLEFKNVSPQQREARAQIALPPGAVVSRLTLWINGEEREAAFGGRSQVREAYQQVAVVRRRDPVLVTTCGPDRVLIQCFPVPADGGMMKVRLGITAPLVLESMSAGRFFLPHLLERNFRVPAELKHACWLASGMPLSGGHGSTSTNVAPGRPFTWQTSLSETELAESPAFVEVQRPRDVKLVQAQVEGSSDLIRQTIQQLEASRPSRVVIVVDGSVGMREFLPGISEALSGIPEAMKISVTIAGDELRTFPEKPQKATLTVRESLRRELRATRCAGGQDNLPALEQAWDLASSSGNGVVIWIHQPEPALLTSESGLVQRIERSIGIVRFCEIQTLNGPDRIVEKLDGFPMVSHVPRVGSVNSDLKDLFGSLSGTRAQFALVRERVSAAPEASNLPSAGKHLVRLWARDEVLRRAAHHDPDGAAKLAATYELVTPFSGAVVLETQQQYSQHGLKPSDPATVPSVPEPQTWMLLGLGILSLVILNRSRRKPRSLRMDTPSPPKTQ